MTIQYDPQKVTDWVTPLEKVYARQSQQLDLYHSQLRERDKQEEAATFNLPEFVDKLASFSQTIASVVDARKKEQKSKEWENVNKVLNTAEASEEARTILEPYKLNKKGLVEEWKTFEEKVKKSTVLSQEQKAYLLENSARRQLRVKEVLGQRKASELPNLWTDAINNKSDWQDRYRKYEIAGDTNGIAALRNEFVTKTIGDYRYSDGFLFENVKKESDRFLNTKNTTDKIKAKNIKLTNKEVTFEEDNNQLLLTGTPEQLGELNYDYVTDKAVLASDPAAYETAIQQGTEKWVFTQEKFLLTAKDNHGDLEKLLNSKVEHGAFVTKDNPKGITTFRKAFLSDEQVQRLTKAANEGVKVKWETNKTSKELEQKTFIQKVQSGQVTKDEWLAEIEVLERSPHANKELITELKELNPDAQNAAVEANLTKEWDVHIENGFYGKTEEDIEAIPNYNVKKKAREKWDQLQKAEVKHGSSKGDMDQTVHRSRTAIPWANKESMDPTGKLIARELDIAGEQYRAGLVYAQYSTGTYIPDPEIATKTNLFKKALWESRGGGQEGGDGRYSVDVMEGSFKNFQTASRMRIRANDSHNLKYTVENGDAWAAGIQTKINSYPKLPDGNFDYEGFIESGQAYSKQDLIGTITNNSYSEKMQYIADYLNTDVETLFESSLKEANKDKEFARRWSFDKLEKPIDTQIREDLERAFKKYEGDPTKAYQLKDLKYLMKKGWKNLSNNQKSRVYATLVANSSLSEEAGTDADEARQEKDKAVADALSLERLQVEQKRRKEKEDKEKQRNEQAEQLQEQIEGLWTP